MTCTVGCRCVLPGLTSDSDADVMGDEVQALLQGGDFSSQRSSQQQQLAAATDDDDVSNQGFDTSSEQTSTPTASSSRGRTASSPSHTPPPLGGAPGRAITCSRPPSLTCSSPSQTQTKTSRTSRDAVGVCRDYFEDVT